MTPSHRAPASPEEHVVRRRTMGNTSVAVTDLGFGASVIGNLYRVTPAQDASAAVDAAWEAGIRYFDTAPHYGLGRRRSHQDQRERHLDDHQRPADRG